MNNLQHRQLGRTSSASSKVRVGLLHLDPPSLTNCKEIFEWLPLVLEQERELQRQKMQKKPKPKKKTGDEPPEPNEDSVPAPPVIHNSDGTMTYAEDGPGDSEEEMT